LHEHNQQITDQVTTTESDLLPEASREAAAGTGTGERKDAIEVHERRLQGPPQGWEELSLDKGALAKYTDEVAQAGYISSGEGSGSGTDELIARTTRGGGRLSGRRNTECLPGRHASGRLPWGRLAW